ncbi:MAG: DNA-protecting protein DprA [Desulfobacteraceae bacterium]|nr:MAG: DNA-protecting protein DprA [Desulfobacteraceae bacterium]
MATSSPDNILEWLTLQLVPGLGPVGCKNLISRFGSAESVFLASPRELSSVEGVREDVAAKILKKKRPAIADRILRTVERTGARILRITDQEYPPLLREIHDPPLLLYVRGREIPPALPFIAVVGSRNPTSYGTKAAGVIGQGFAVRGVGVASGMATGIDSAAHWGSMEQKGFPLAVLGTGIDVVYPESNKKLHEKLIEKGAVVSELVPGTPPEPWNFPSRNRIISGISRAVVVVEATMKSGSLITASLALEQGREVFAVPGSIDSFKSTGCHFLIKQGAKLVENADDVLEELSIGRPRSAGIGKTQEIPFPPLEEKERAIYDMLSNYPLHIDLIVRQGNLPAGEVSSILMKMELRGIVRQLPGKMFIR